MICAFCKKRINIKNRVGRTDTCPHCGNDLHCCKQCKFYDPKAYNECREISADRVMDKERANFCEFFIPKGSSVKRYNKVENAKAALEALFKKK